MNNGKQIRLFLTDGSANGLRYAELVNWTGQAFACSQSHFAKLGAWPETQRPGVYVLLGFNKKDEDVVYIGESECVQERIKQHVAKQTLSEIREAFFFTSKDDNLTKGHIVHLEQQLLKRAKEAKRYPIVNDQVPGHKPLSKPELATMKEFLENLLLVSAAMGYDVFNIPPNGPEDPEGGLFLFKLKNGIEASGYLADGGFVVKTGSSASLEDTASLKDGYRGLREQLKANGVLVAKANVKGLKFTQDYLFNSSSAAASVVAGSQRNGPGSWYSAGNETLGDIQRSRMKLQENPTMSRDQMGS